MVSLDQHCPPTAVLSVSKSSLSCTHCPPRPTRKTPHGQLTTHDPRKTTLSPNTSCTFVRFLAFGWEDVRDGCEAFLVFRVGSARILTGKGPPPTAGADHHASHRGGRTMENSPLSDQPTSEDDAAVFPDSGSRREQSSHDRELPARAATHTRGARPRVRSWMRAGALDWGIRIAVVGLMIGGFFAIYINGVNEGWWHPWGHTPTVTTTGPTAQPTPAPTASSEPAMSGGYQIGPDGVLVRPAEYAPETYTKPELPEAAKENTERGAEAAAEHYLAVATYAWNTGDTSAIAALSDDSSGFAQSLINKIDAVYSNGWAYGDTLTVNHVLLLEPVPANGADVPPNTIGVKFGVTAVDGTRCSGQRVTIKNEEYQATISLFMTWQGDRWIETQGRAEANEH